MSSSLPLQIAETIQTASINRNPDPARDLNPTTSASRKQPVSVSHHDHPPSSSLDSDAFEDIDADEELDGADEDDIPYDVFLPLAQGTLWGLALHGWRFWNKNAQLNGSSVGARVRRWWYRTNNWSVDLKPNGSASSPEMAARVGDFYKNQQGTGLD
ncbi:MAG: hypothetical protein M1818_000223 [Claussenomyces sp. TS43310]|nr:MAG: hypothetical protein M1818_000223 [Claussenomyces sp. TS43310]